jgi:hypothetical protein
MHSEASYSVPLHCAVTFCAPALAPLSEASVGLLGEPGVVCRDYSEFPGESHSRFIPFTVQVFGRIACTKLTALNKVVESTRFFAGWSYREHRIPSPDPNGWGMNRTRLQRGPMRQDLMTTGSSVRVANKLSEERLRQARNGNHNVKENRYSYSSLTFFSESTESTAKVKYPTPPTGPRKEGGNPSHLWFPIRSNE